jgi:hypothetical protein
LAPSPWKPGVLNSSWKCKLLPDENCVMQNPHFYW